jgi:hypothetical protein
MKKMVGTALVALIAVVAVGGTGLAWLEYASSALCECRQHFASAGVPRLCGFGAGVGTPGGGSLSTRRL